MYRRLFFLFPDKSGAHEAVQLLMHNDVSTEQMHALSKPGVDLQGLPASSTYQQQDVHSKIEESLWNLNLGIFFVAFFIMLMSFISENYFVVVSSLIVMAGTYGVGFFYLRKPTIHLSGFHAAFQHGEVLLMVDIPKSRVAEIEHIISHKTPSATDEGISWTPSNLSLNI